MTCAVHTDTEATGFCGNCGKAMCAQCTREVNGTFYCQDCLGALIAAQRPAESPTHAPLPGASVQNAGAPLNADPHSGPVQTAPHISHPGVALALGFIPGLGAVYNGEYIKGLVHVAIFGGIIAALNTQMPEGYEAFLGIALSCFYLYMPIEAYRTARNRLASGPDAHRSGRRRSGAQTDWGDRHDYHWRAIPPRKPRMARPGMDRQRLAGNPDRDRHLDACGSGSAKLRNRERKKIWRMRRECGAVAGSAACAD